jgi:hypothetical protein
VVTQWDLRSHPIAAVAIGTVTAGVAGAAAATLPGLPPVLALAGASVLTIVLAFLPFRWTSTAIIVASGFTQFELSGLPVHLRADVMLVPAGLLCCAWHRQIHALVHWLRHPVMLLLGAYVALQFAVSAVASPDPGKSFSVAAWLFLDLMIVGLALACFGGDRSALMRRLMLTGLLVVLSGIGGWLYTRYSGSTWGAAYDPAYGLRANGIAYEPNILAGTAAIWAIIILTKGERLLLRDWLFLVLALAVIPATTTRAAPIAILCGVAVYFSSGVRRLSRLVLIGISFLVAAIVVQVIAPDNWASIVAKIGDFSDQTATHRATEWLVALQDLHGWGWLFGLGTNSFGQRHIDPTLVAQQVPGYLGNLPLQTMYDSGALGLALLLAAAWLLVRQGSSRRRFAILTTFLIISSATSPFFFGNWWLFVAAGLAQPTVGPASNTLAAARRRFLAATGRTALPDGALASSPRSRRPVPLGR